VDIGINMGNNMIEGGGRRHGFQILKERAGSYPMRGFSLPNRNATTWNMPFYELYFKIRIQIDSTFKKEQNDIDFKISRGIGILEITDTNQGIMFFLTIIYCFYNCVFFFENYLTR
jgi:hypothetical protein